MAKSDDAQAYFKQGFSCSQAVFSAYAEDFGVDEETALRVAAAFGGGWARSGNVCGAASGALMVLGMKYGMVRADAPEAKERTYAIAQEFAERFRAANGAVDCRDLLGHDMSTAEGRQAIKEAGVTKTLCPGLVQNATEILDELLSRDTPQA
jgi:C_GCAxxG_C_C family probable redox protein